MPIKCTRGIFIESECESQKVRAKTSGSSCQILFSSFFLFFSVVYALLITMTMTHKVEAKDDTILHQSDRRRSTMKNSLAPYPHPPQSFTPNKTKHCSEVRCCCSCAVAAVAVARCFVLLFYSFGHSHCFQYTSYGEHKDREVCGGGVL